MLGESVGWEDGCRRERPEHRRAELAGDVSSAADRSSERRDSERERELANGLCVSSWVCVERERELEGEGGRRWS